MKTKKANGVEYYHDWDNSEGGICMKNAKTIKHYRELKNENHKTEDYGVFFAFGEKQFEEGRQQLIAKGYLKEGEKVLSAGLGLYGTQEGIDRYMAFYEVREKKIAKECNPQEVYFYEWNNHECMISGEDDDALKVVIGYFGKEEAHKIVRVYPGTPTNILAPLTDKDKHLGEHQDTLMMLSRLKFDCQGFFSEGDCRYHRPDCLWAGSVKGEMDEVRKLYHQLPDDIKDESPLSSEDIKSYGERFDAWVMEEFSKPEYDPKPRTKREDFPGEIRLLNSLFYKDDDGKLQEPNHIWFSHDSRRWHADARQKHGRAYTTYGGKKGTTLAPVYVLADRLVPFVREDLCDVSCKYERKFQQGYLSRLYDFYYE